MGAGRRMGRVGRGIQNSKRMNFTLQGALGKLQPGTVTEQVSGWWQGDDQDQGSQDGREGEEERLVLEGSPSVERQRLKRIWTHEQLLVTFLKQLEKNTRRVNANSAWWQGLHFWRGKSMNKGPDL